MSRREDWYSPKRRRCVVCNGHEDSGVHRRYADCPSHSQPGRCSPDVHHPFMARTMPLHEPVRELTVCSCGWSGSPRRFEAHRRETEPDDVGRWIADTALAEARR